MSIYFQDPICWTESEKECADSIRPDLSDCLPNCEGVMVTSFIKTENEEDASSVAANLYKSYGNYKQHTLSFPSDLKG